MKVKVISRNPDNYLRETKRDIHKVQRNYDPDLHPLESVREYVRALNATKLDKVFAKPFVGNLDGHREGVACFAKHTNRLSVLCSGGYDGEIRIWDLQNRICLQNFSAHEGFVRGICFNNSGDRLISVGDDKAIRIWPGKDFEDNTGNDVEPLNVILSRTLLLGISHNVKDAVFATCGEVCNLWEETRNEPLQAFKWGVDSLHAIAFNPIETTVLAACASDRSIIFYDKREGKPLRKVVLTMKCNKLAWNPMQAFNFTVANEDFNLYTFDTRRLKNPIKVHSGHVSAVTDVDYAPTGKEFTSGSYDKTVRLFDIEKTFSRDVYHAKRMQHVVCVGWSLDNNYIYSGSDEMNIRIWKAKSSQKLGAIRPREKANFNYQEALKEKYAAHPQVKRIANHRHVPKYIYNAQNKIRAIKTKEKKKEANIRKHTRPEKLPKTFGKKPLVLREDK